eukprot:scaffold4372_cov397-Prasinococcus_capsulatus_cf.AAC.18
MAMPMIMPRDDLRRRREDPTYNVWAAQLPPRFIRGLRGRAGHAAVAPRATAALPEGPETWPR